MKCDNNLSPFAKPQNYKVSIKSGDSVQSSRIVRIDAASKQHNRGFAGEKRGKCTWMEVRQMCIKPQAGGGGKEHGSADRKLPIEAVKHTLSSQHVQTNPTCTRLNKVQLHMATLRGEIEQ